MTKILKLMTALAIPASLLFAAGPAEAARPGRLVKRLVKQGALEKADLAGIKQIHKDIRACRKAVRAGSQPKGSCLGKILEGAQARKALLEKGLAKAKPGLQKKVKRALRKLDRRIAKIQARMSKGPAAPAPTPPPAK